MLIGYVDLPVETVVTSPDSASVSAAVSSSPAEPMVVSEVVPSLPAVADAKPSFVAADQLSSSPQPAAQLSPPDQPLDTEGSVTDPAAGAEVQDADGPVRTSPSPANDVTSEHSLTDAETSSQLQEAVSDSAVSVPVSESS